MMELNNLLKSLDIDKDYHDKIFGNMIFENLYTKVDLNKYAAIKNKIYWMSLLIYRISMTNYLKSINKNIDFENKSINIEKNNLIVFHLSLNITSEICKQFSNGEIYPSYISMLCRQIIEQICFIKEVKVFCPFFCQMHKKSERISCTAPIAFCLRIFSFGGKLIDKMAEPSSPVLQGNFRGGYLS